MAVSEGRMPLVLGGGSLTQRNRTFPSLWLRALAPAAEIGGLRRPLPEDLIPAETPGGPTVLERLPEPDTGPLPDTQCFSLPAGGRSEESKPRLRRLSARSKA